MAFVIDEEKINNADMRIMDIGRPPIKQVAYQAYPKMLYLHPKDKTKEHLTKIVQNEAEKLAAVSQGWRTEPHIQQAAAVNFSGDFEAEIPEPPVEKRGPGRPPRAVEAA